MVGGDDRRERTGLGDTENGREVEGVAEVVECLAHVGDPGEIPIRVDRGLGRTAPTGTRRASFRLRERSVEVA